MENRRLLLAAVLSALVLIVWNYMVMSVRPPEEELPELAPEESVAAPQEGAGPGAEEPPPAEVSEAVSEPGPREAAAEPALDFGAEVVKAATEETVVLETAKFRAELTNRGAQLVSLLLKEHRTADGELLELIRPRGSDPYPFALVVDGEKSHRLNHALFEHSEEVENGLQTLTFRHRSELGAAEKVFRLTPQGFVDVRVTVEGGQDWGLVFGPGLRRFDAGEAKRSLVNHLAAFRTNDGDSGQYRPQKTKEDVSLPAAPLEWVTLEDNFFLSAVLPRHGLAEVVFRPVRQRPAVVAGEPRFLPVGSEIEGEELSPEILMLLQASGDSVEMLVYFGAKQYRQLAALQHDLQETVRWGFFGMFARPLYFALEWIHERLVANYGWAVVLVTLLIRLLFFPLTYKSQESMAKMQELNPKIQAIKQKYRGKLKDRQGRPNLEAHRAMQEEQSALLREAGVNPAASCLPMLLQMPVFFAFYRLLATAVELRNAPWIGWIHDLSTPDPYYILPLVMGATSVTMQRMMPSSADPVQRRVIQLMPIMFTFFALAFPSGLVLYWVTNNLLSMLQQAVMLKLKKRRKERSKA